MSNQLRAIAAASTAVKVREEEFKGRKHLVVPVVALVEGVLQTMNAENPEFVAAEEFTKAPTGWNGRPVFVDHPTINGVPVFGNQPDILEKRQIGLVFNAAISKGKLVMEAWIDVETTKIVDPALLERIASGDPIEVSVGLLCETTDETGTYNGKKYKGAWKDLIPDHLAILSKGHIGACSREMGCGVRAAAQRAGVIKHEGEKWVLYSHDGKKQLGSFDSEDEAKKREQQINFFKHKKGAMRIDKTFGGLFARMMATFRPAQAASDMSSNDLLRKLNESLRKVVPNLNYVETYLPVQDPNRVIYCTYSEEGPHTYERTFALAENGDVTFGENEVEVEAVLYYEPVLMNEDPEELKAAIGRRNSAKDQAKIQAMHDHACALGASCDEYKAAIGNGNNQYVHDNQPGGKKGPSKTNPTQGLNDSDKELVQNLTHDVLEDFAPDSITGDDIIAIEDSVEKGEPITEKQGDLLANALEDWAGNEYDDIHEDDDEARNEERRKEADKIMEIVKKMRGAETRTAERKYKQEDLRDLLRRNAQKFVK